MFSQREVEIIKFLIDQNDYISGEKISTFIGISSKTLQKDIKVINQQLELVNTNAQISSMRGKGYILETDNKEVFYKELLRFCEANAKDMRFIPTTSEGRINYIIKKLLFLELKGERGITQLQFCDSLFISLTTLKSDLNIVKEKLQKFNIEVVKYGIKGIALQGNEDDLRSCIRYYIFQKPESDIVDLNCITPIFKKEQIEIVKEILSSIIGKSKVAITDIGFYNLLIHILIAIRRIQNNNKIENIEFTDVLKNTYEYNVATEIAGKVSEATGVELPEGEVCFITQHLYTQKTIGSGGIKRQLNLPNKYHLLVKEVLENLKETIDIDFTKDELLIWSLATHLKSAINRIKFDMSITNDMLYEIKRNYSFTYNIALIAANFIEKIIGKSISEDEVGFICLHFAAAFERLKDERNKEKLRALIICASGLGTSMVLSAKIKKEFSDAIQIVNVLPLNRLDSIPMDEYDAIISTVKIDTAANNLNDKKVIYTSPMLKQEDIATIRDFINSNKKVSILRFLEFTEEDLFFVDKEFETKEEIINYMVNNMIKKGYLKEEDRESFFKRENISSTEIGNLIAIPHALDTDPEISKVSILMMKKPIIWEEEQVRLVILMSIEKRLYLEFGEIIEELYLRLENKEKVIELLSAKNYTEFIKILR